MEGLNATFSQAEESQVLSAIRAKFDGMDAEQLRDAISVNGDGIGCHSYAVFGSMILALRKGKLSELLNCFNFELFSRCTNAASEDGDTWQILLDDLCEDTRAKMLEILPEVSNSELDDLFLDIYGEM